MPLTPRRSLRSGHQGQHEVRCDQDARATELPHVASYPSLVSFSNLGGEPDAFDQSNRKLHFQMRISPTCWYDVTASYSRSYSRGESPWISLRGGGDDFGVFITASPSSGITVGPQLAPGQKAGPDARAIMRSLYAIPGFRNFTAIER